MYILTLDATNKCLTIDRGTSGVSYDKESILYANIDNVQAEELSTDVYKPDGTVTRAGTNFSNSNYNFVNKVIITKGEDSVRMKQFVEIIDLLNDNYAWSTAPTVKLTSASSVRDAIVTAVG
jgi:hypothetical protein